MGIEDIQISEELETSAPSIRYSGDEGPKSPQEEMMMVDAVLEEEYEKYVFDLLEKRPDAEPMSIEEFKRMVIGDMETKLKRFLLKRDGDKYHVLMQNLHTIQNLEKPLIHLLQQVE